MHLELFYRNNRNLEVLFNEDLDFVKTKTKKTALYSFRQSNKCPQQNLSKEELAALASLSKSLIKVILLLLLTRKPKLRKWKIF